MDLAPMYLIGAKKTDSEKIRFVFMIPSGASPDVMDGNGAVLEITGFRELKVGEDTPLRGSLLEAFIETFVEGDDETEGKGPLPCGFAIAGNELQIVDYFNGELIVKCKGKFFSYMADIDMTNFEEGK